MVAIHTSRNVVTALEPMEGDLWVETLLGGGDGVTRRLSLLPIRQYQQAVDWTVSVADQFALPIHIVPISRSSRAEVKHTDPRKSIG